MNKRHLKTLSEVFSRPVKSSIKWSDIESMLIALEAKIHEREISRGAVTLKGEKNIFHRPRPQPATEKGRLTH
ncbi:type II toxin-antitoxin system HicA family toxin [Salmonella enterica]|nr:type II toxin-antitoxin system HicA family toxin [Salmonella enterica]